MDDTKMDKVVDTCLLAGRLMIEGGSEMYRVEDTVKRIAYNSGEKESAAFTTLTGVLMSVKDQPSSHFMQVNKRGIDMEKVDRVNTLSRKYAQKEITLDKLNAELHKLDYELPTFPFWLQILGAAVVSATLMIVFAQEYDWFDIPLSAFVGAVGYVVAYFVRKTTSISFISDFLGAFSLGGLAMIGVRLGIGSNLNNVIIGAVMPLVPGVAITNALRDMLAGHLLSGLERGLEALLSACAISVGIAVIFRYF
jgi:Uncharacterized conserved protein